MSDDFKELMEFLLAYEPSARPVMADIIGHPWMRAESITDEDFKTKVDAYIEQIKVKQNKDQEKMDVDYQIILNPKR